MFSLGYIFLNGNFRSILKIRVQSIIILLSSIFISFGNDAVEVVINAWYFYTWIVVSIYGEKTRKKMFSWLEMNNARWHELYQLFY